MRAFYRLIGGQYSSRAPAVKEFATVFDRIETLWVRAPTDMGMVSIACETFRSIICTTGVFGFTPPAEGQWGSELLFGATGQRSVSGGIAMLLVTLHGGHPGNHPRRNNVHAYDKNGKLLSPAILEERDELVLDELRGIYLYGKYLYVVVANKTQNSVLCYEGSETSYRFVSKFASQETTEGILHPFDLHFDEAGYCYLSSQDTNVVTRLSVTEGDKTARPAPLPVALEGRGKFSAGTFIASSAGTLSPAATTAVAAPAGLEFSNEGAKKHSVRGIVWSHGALYVADQPAGRIKVYDRDGKYLGQSNPVETPIHLVANGNKLFVSGANEVLQGDLTGNVGNLRLTAVPGLHVKNGGGMAFSSSGNLYIASRTENKIFKFGPDFKPLPFPCELPDNPEFLLHV